MRAAYLPVVIIPAFLVLLQMALAKGWSHEDERAIDRQLCQEGKGGLKCLMANDR